MLAAEDLKPADPDGRNRSRVSRTVLVMGGAACLWAVLRVAWMSDDGLINVRTALNLSVGEGPVFNVGEKVQAYTSPLWFWLQSLFGLISGEFILAAIGLGAAASTAAIVGVIQQSRNAVRAALVVLCFVMSPSLVDYSTGGLENGLGMALLVGLVSLAPTLGAGSSARRVAAVGLLASLVVLTRLDYALIIAPLVAVTAFGLRTAPRRTVLAGLAGGAVPLVLWFGWSFAYYGAFTPNTALAKLNTHIPRADLVESGLRYLTVSIGADPVVGLVLVGACVVAVASRSRTLILAMLGVASYLAYVVWIGGDFMAGRFLTGPAIVAAWVIACADIPRLAAAPRVRWLAATGVRSSVCAAVVLAVSWGSMVAGRPTHDSAPRWRFGARWGIADEAAFYRHAGLSAHSALFDAAGNVGFTEIVDRPTLAELRVLEDRWFAPSMPPPGEERPVVVRCGGLGGVGISSGPGVHVVDPCGLTDPFLAAVPFTVEPGRRWRIGHFERPVPDGYLDAVRFADPSFVVDAETRAQLVEVWSRVRS